MNRGDRRKLLRDFTLRTSYSVGTLPAGTVVTVQEVDKEHQKVLISDVWVHEMTLFNWSLPVEEE